VTNVIVNGGVTQIKAELYSRVPAVDALFYSGDYISAVTTCEAVAMPL
jgi:hypothetical protein